MSAEPLPPRASDESTRPNDQADPPSGSTEPAAPASTADPLVAATTAEAIAAQAVAADAGAEAPATEASATTVAAPAVQPAPDAVVERPSRRVAALAVVRRVATFMLAVALFAAGVLGGYTLFLRSQTPPVPLGDPVAASAEPPAVAREFIGALALNDFDAIRSSLDPQPHQDLTDELEKYSIERVNGVTTLGTQEDGDRSATMVLLDAEQPGGIPFAINLVILVDGGKIEGFR
jgi:hypothetical protein